MEWRRKIVDEIAARQTYVKCVALERRVACTTATATAAADNDNVSTALCLMNLVITASCDKMYNVLSLSIILVACDAMFHARLPIGKLQVIPFFS